MDSQLFRLNQMSYQHHKQFQLNQASGPHQQQQQPQPRHLGPINLQHQHQQQQQHQKHLQASRQHYSNRQLQAAAPSASSTGARRSQQQQQQQQQQQPGPAAAAPPRSRTSASSGSDDLDEQVQLSSLSTAATSKSNASSQAAILASHQARASSAGQMQREQHHQMLRQQQAQHQRHLQAAGQNRQAALQAHTLAALPSSSAAAKHQQQQHHKNGSGGNNLPSSDQLTTSSDQTIDDLHHLAPLHHGAYATSGGGGGASRHHHHQMAAAAAGRYGGDAAGASSRALDSQSGSRFLLGVLFTIAELLLFATVFLWLYWAYQHDDGLAWQTDRKQQFNTHAALMLFGFIFLSGQAMLIHRSFSCCSKIYTKILHTILFVLATSAISLGLILAYTAQENVGANNKPIMHFYSLHAWCGLTTVALFVLQFVFGFVSFLILLCCDQATANYRAALLPIHKTFGLIIFSLAVATCLTGLLQTARSRLSSKLNKTDYHELAEPGIVINLIGVCLISLAILMPYIIRNLDIKPPASFRSEFERHLNKLSQLEMRI